MKRAGRWLFNFAAAVSLVLCVAAVALWIRSYLAQDRWFYSRFWDDPEWAQWSQHAIQTGKGALGYQLIVQAMPKEVGWQREIALARVPKFEHTAKAAAYPDSGLRWATSLWGFTYGAFGQPTRPMHVGPDEFANPIWRGMKPPWYGYTIIAPFWAMVLLFGLLPMLWYRRWRGQRHTRLNGCCVECGYDLRATRDRCPECGTIPSAVKGVAT